MDNIKKIVDKIIRLFINFYDINKNPDKKKKVNAIPLKELVPELKAIDHEKLFSVVRPGDIIYAVSSPSSTELIKLPQEHRTRPYIVATNNGSTIEAYSGTSNPDRKYKHSFTLSKENYNLNKSGKINLSKVKILKVGMITCIVGKLIPTDVTAINAEILSIKKEKAPPHIEKQFPVKGGLILEKNRHFYYINGINKTEAILYRMYKDASKPVSIRVGSTHYYIDPDEQIVEKDISSYTKVGFKDSKQNIKEKIQKYKVRKSINYVSMNSFANQCKYNYSIGQVFESKGSYVVYLFSINGNDFGFEEDDLYNGEPKIKILNHLDFCKKEEIMDKETLDYAINSIANRSYNYIWLKDIISKEEAKA